MAIPHKSSSVFVQYCDWDFSEKSIALFPDTVKYQAVRTEKLIHCLENNSYKIIHNIRMEKTKELMTEIISHFPTYLREGLLQSWNMVFKSDFSLYLRRFRLGLVWEVWMNDKIRTWRKSLYATSIIQILQFQGNTAQRLCVRCAVRFFVRWNKKRSEYFVYSRAFLWNMTENMQAYDVQSRQALFVRCCLKLKRRM